MDPTPFLDAIPIPAQWFKLWMLATLVLSLVLRVTRQIQKPWAQRTAAICFDVLGLLSRGVAKGPVSDAVRRGVALAPCLATGLTVLQSTACGGSPQHPPTAVEAELQKMAMSELVRVAKCGAAALAILNESPSSCEAALERIRGTPECDGSLMLHFVTCNGIAR